MYYAKDGRGKLVTASGAAAGLYYRCPECGKQAFLKPGKRNSAHFAHRPGQGTAKCELFHPSYYLSGPSPRYDLDADPSAPPIPPLSLSIELDPTPQSRLTSNRDWKLALTVPKAPDMHGSVRIDCGMGTPRLISLSKLALDPQTYPASFSAEDFGAMWVSPDVNSRYKAAIEHRIPGLNRIVANAFVNGKQKQKPLASSLTWGAAYYLISHDSHPISIPASVPSSQLAKRDGWSCSLVTLPDEEDDEIGRWIEEACNLTIARARRHWAIIYPPAIDIDSLGCLHVASTRQLLLATFTPYGEDDEQGSFSASAGRSQASAPIKQGIQFFTVQHDGKADTSVALDWDGISLPGITQAATPDVLNLSGVAFRFRSRSGAERYRSFLHLTEIEALLQNARRSECDISNISPPAGCAGAFKWRKTLGQDWQDIQCTVPRGGVPDVAEDTLKQINLLLQDSTLDVMFDFGGLGSCYLKASGRHAAHPRPNRIPETVRDRIIWFCIAAKSYPRGASRQFTALADDALVRHFRASATPSFLIAHRRHLDALVGTFPEASEAS